MKQVYKQTKLLIWAFPMLLMSSPALAIQPSEPVPVMTTEVTPVVSAQRINPTTIDLVFRNGQRMTFDFYGPNIFRMF